MLSGFLLVAALAQSPTVAEINALPAVGTVDVGAEVRDSLRPVDLVRGGRHLRVWRLRAPAGAPVTVDLLSDDFDPLLTVVGPGLFLLEDDDGGGACNARVTFTPAADGEYRLGVSSLAGPATGGFRLRVSPRPPPAARGPCAVSAVATPRFPPAAVDALTPAGRVAPGDTVRGRLSTAPLVDGRPVVVYALRGAAGQTVTVDLRSSAFDAYLGFWGPGLPAPRTDDDGAGLCDARLTLTLPASGTYRVLASAFDSTARGPFVLTVASEAGPMAPGTCSDAQRASPTTLEKLPVRGDLTPGTEVRGTLDPAGATLDNGSYAEAWHLRGRAGERYHLTLRSTDFDAFLFVSGPDLLRSDDDGGGGTDACLAVTLPATGAYRVVASSFATERGRYTLAARPLPAGLEPCQPDEGGAWAEVPLAGRLAVGEEVQGTLDSASGRAPDGQLAAAYTLEGTRGQAVTLDLLSAAFDAAVVLVGPGIIGMMMDDDSGGACNARLTVNLPATGTFRVIATTMTGGRGPFVLRATGQPGPVNPSACLMQ